MKLSKKIKLTLPAIAAGALMVSSMPAAAQQLDSILKLEEGGNRYLAQSQRQIDQISDQTDSIVDEYRGVIVQIETLKVYNAQLRKLIRAQKQEMTRLEEQIDYVTLVERRIMPLVQEMIDSLRVFVAADVPFLAAERKDRVERLQALMIDSTVTTSERYRQTLAALEIENEYGRKVGTYQADMDVEGDGIVQTVNFLHVGRVAFIFQTKDKEDSYVWDQAGQEWVELSSSSNGPVYDAIQMARGFVQSDVVELPIFAPQEAGQ